MLILFYIIVTGTIFVYFFTLNMGSELELELESWSRSRPFFHGSGSSQKERLWLHNTACYIATATQLHSHSYAVT